MKITKNQPIPPSSGGRPAKYLWLEDLDVGDCIELDTFDDFERVRGAMIYRKIKHTTRTKKCKEGTCWPSKDQTFKIWVTSNPKKT